MGPASKEIKTVDDLKAFLGGQEPVVVGFFEKDDSPLSAAFHTVSKKLREKVGFAHTSDAEVLKSEDLK